jgi:glycine/D-amino acid oxidase-like deaminating enzyme
VFFVLVLFAARGRQVAALEGGADHALFDAVVWPALYKCCPAFAALKVKSSWAGFYEYNALDQNAVLGRHPDVPNLVLCNGFSGHGLQQSPGAGRAVAELITRDRFTTVDASCFGFERVVQNKPLYEDNIV